MEKKIKKKTKASLARGYNLLLSILGIYTVISTAPYRPRLATSIQYRASNLDWQLISYMILYMYQCHSPKSSHPLPLPQSP